MPHNMSCAVTVVALLLHIVPVEARADSLQPRIQIAERGIYRADTVQRGSPNEKGIIVNTVQSARLIANTTSILAGVGVRFGLRYTVVGPLDYNPELKLVIKFPPGGLRDPATRHILFQSEFSMTVAPDTTNYWEYHFENDWELLGGLWTFEFWHKARKVAEQRFCVREARTVSKPEFMTSCGSGLVR